MLEGLAAVFAMLLVMAFIFSPEAVILGFAWLITLPFQPFKYLLEHRERMAKLKIEAKKQSYEHPEDV